MYGCIDMRDAYDYLDSLGADPAAEIAGASSAAYTEAYGTFYFATEVPHWAHPEADDDTPCRRVTRTSCGNGRRDCPTRARC